MPPDEAMPLQGIPSWLVSGVIHLLLLMAIVLVPVDATPLPLVRIVGADVLNQLESTSDELVLSEFGDDADQIAARGIVVEDALRWLVAQQRADGGWPATAGDRRSSDRESTALVMLALLQAGQTHRSGAYQREMRGAVGYLAAPGKTVKSTRAHALATLVLCDLYGHSHDKQLQLLAQQAVDQLCAAQTPTGGWDSGGGQEADSELATWSLLALKEAHLSYLSVSPASCAAAARWFNQQAAANAQSKPDDVDPGILLGQCFFGLRRHPQCQAQIERLTAEQSSSRTLVADHFATRLVCEFGTRPAADDWLQRMKLRVKSSRAGEPQRQDIHATALRVLIERSRCSKWMIHGADAAEDDFPL